MQVESRASVIYDKRNGNMGGKKVFTAVGWGRTEIFIVKINCPQGNKVTCFNAC